MKIADAHAHIFPDALAEKAAKSIGDFYNVKSENFASCQVLAEREQEAGVCTCLVCNSAVNAHQVHSINDFVAASCKAYENFIGLGSVFPGMEGWEEELDRIEAMGLRGIKIHSDFQKVDIDDPKAVELYRVCAKKGFVVLFHMGDDRYDHSSPARLLNLKRQVPDLVAISAHFGGYHAWEDSLKTPMPEGIWYDTSSSLMFLDADQAKRLLDKLGTHRFMFGSDFPMWTPKTELERFLNAPLGLSKTETQDILYHNFARLFGLGDAG